MHPIDILRFAKILFPNLYQSTAFGLTGLVTLDMLSKLQAEDPESSGVDLIFLDTLYHFDETYQLIDRVRARYPNTKLHIFKPEGCSTAADFEARYGADLYHTASDLYDWYAKVEPQQRAYQELGVAAVLTGRRRSQGGQRGDIPVIEIDDERGIVKINPMVNWSFKQVQDYVREHDVPYNALLDRGYKSVGDWHSTQPVAEGEDERAGRWKGQDKTECGIHNKKSRYAQYLAEKEAREQRGLLSKALDKAASAISA
jgi:phosphoadenosine phosphosulfate reductase